MTARSFLITVAASAALTAPGILLAQGGFGGPQGQHGPHGFDEPGLHRFEDMLPRMVEFLDLSTDQQAQIEQILAEEMPAIEDLRDRLHSSHEAFRSTHQPGQFNESEFRAFAESQSQLHVELMVAGARTRSRVHNVLTAEQQEQLQDARGLFGRRGGPGRGRGPNPQ